MKKLLLLMVFTTFCIMLSVSIFAFDNIESGNSWDNVKEVQQMLIELGYLDGIVDGSFGPATEQAVINFQADSGLAANGIVGEETFYKLKKTYDDLVSDISLVSTASNEDWKSVYKNELINREQEILEVQNWSYGYTCGISFADITGDGVPEMIYLYFEDGGQGTFAYKIVSFQNNSLQTIQNVRIYNYEQYYGDYFGMVNDLGLEASRCIFTVYGSDHIYVLRGMGEYVEGDFKPYDQITEYEYSGGLLYPVKTLSYGEAIRDNKYVAAPGMIDDVEYSQETMDYEVSNIVNRADVILASYHQ